MLEVKSGSGTPLRLEVPLPDQDVTEPELWRIILERDLERSLIRSTGKADGGVVKEIVNQAIARPKMKTHLQQCEGMWRGANSFADVMNAWGIEELIPPAPNYEDHIKEEMQDLTVEKNKPGVSVPQKPPEKKKSSWSWLLPLLILGVIGGIWLVRSGDDPEVSYALKLEAMQTNMMGYWDNCLKVQDKPGQSLRDLVPERDYKLLYDDYRLKVKKLIIDYSPGEEEPLGEAIEYLRNQKQTIDNFCGCNTRVSC